MKSISEICEKYKIENYIINDDGSIDVNGDVDLTFKNLTKLPLKFNYINGFLDCRNNKLKSLEGCPKEVVKYFDCSNNRLTSLEFSPEKVGGNFYCIDNKISELDGIGQFEYLYSDILVGNMEDYLINIKLNRLKLL